MQRAAAQSRIDTNRFEMGSKNKPITATVEAIRDLRVNDSRRVETAPAASTHARRQRAMRCPIRMNRGEFRIWISPNETQLRTDFLSQLNFEFLRDKNLMNVFTIHLGRVYRACPMKELIDSAVGFAAGGTRQN
jgi:hypothetical protein